jgi:hypothetical protein
MHSSDHVWALVLGAGEGRRLQSLTRSLRGRPRPEAILLTDGRTLSDAIFVTHPTWSFVKRVYRGNGRAGTAAGV